MHRATHRTARLLTATAISVVVVPWVATPSSAAAASTSAPGAGPSATVTVSKTSDLGNEAVTVSWSGFTPSSALQLQNGGDTYDTSTLNPVRVYQCRGTAPVSSSDCYGSPGFRGVPASGADAGVPAVPGFTYAGQRDPYANTPDGPSNWQDIATAPDGTGQVTLQLFTRREAPSLGCDQTSPCSLVVLPNYGRDTGAGAVEDELDAPWAWARRTVVPLTFLALDDNCPLGGKPLGVEGSPSAARALASWRGAACTARTGPVAIDYTAIGEPQSREDVTSGLSDVALVSRPLPVDSRPAHHLGYASIAVSAVAIAFQVDDLNGRPVEHLNLDARLVAKLITASYRIADDPGVVGNPTSLFRDPEFRALNPGVAWPGGSPGNHVLLLGDLSDATWTLTRWIDADTTARAFLDGTPDPYGMHVNLAYRHLALPVSTFPLLDAAQQDSFQPVQGLDHVARQLSLSQFPGALTSYENGLAVVTKPSRQPAGRRETLGIIDTADAAAFRIPTASLLNSAGRFVAPDPAGLSAAAASLTVAPDGSIAPLTLAATAKAGYPLLLPVQAVVPTDQTGAVRTSVLRFLDFVLGPGQVQGDLQGQLPDGYLPVPSLLRAQAARTRAAVATGPPPVQPTATPTPTATQSRAPAVPEVTVGHPPSVVLPVATRPRAAPVSVSPAPVLAAPPALANLLSDPETPGGSNALPALLLAGATALLVGPLTMTLTRRGRAPSWLTS